jgi:hypothetical protein
LTLPTLIGFIVSLVLALGIEGLILAAVEDVAVEGAPITIITRCSWHSPAGVYEAEGYVVL